MNFILAILLFANVGITDDSAVTETTIKNPAKITAAKTYYDRKEGIVMFNGNVHVNDSEYQMHADKAFVFLTITNSLERIVAIGNVALTNMEKRAYGEKVSYRSDSGLIVLYGGTNRVAEVREVAKDGDRIVRGKKIKFWINKEQVEVMEADINAPVGDMKDVTPGFGK